MGADRLARLAPSTDMHKVAQLLAQTSETTRFVAAQFQSPPSMERVFTKVQHEEFRLKSDLSMFGAVIDQLPQPAREIAGQDSEGDEKQQ